MSGIRKNGGKNESSTSTNLKPDPRHGGLIRFGEVLVTRRFRKESQPPEQKLQDPALRAVARLQSAAGVCCLRKADNEYVVKFNDWDAAEGYRKKFWIKILCKDGAWEIGPYFMPTCFNKKKVEAANTDESLRIGRFLTDCKTLVECFTFRKQQFKELEDFLESSDLYYAIPHADESYKIFSIRLQRKVENRFRDPSLIVVRLGYSENTTKPSSLLIESADDLALAESDRETLHNSFKVFKQIQVAEALEQIFNSPESEEIWKRKVPALGERAPINRSNRSIRRIDESSESDDSSQVSEKNNDEKTLTSAREKRSRLADDFSDVSDSETRNKNAEASRNGRGNLQTAKNVATSSFGKETKTFGEGKNVTEKQNSKSKTKRARNSKIRPKPSLETGSSDRENEIAKNSKRKAPGAKKVAGAKVVAKRKKT